MKHRNRRLAYIIFSLLLSITLLASSTYAWFSSNKKVSMSGVDIRVSSVDTIEVSADARDFSSSITYLDIINADYDSSISKKNSLPQVFEPVSTVGNLDDGNIDMYYGVVGVDMDSTSATYGSKTLTAAKVSDVDGTKGKYMAFDMYFNNYGPRTIYLSRSSYVKYTGSTEGIQNAIRIAFVYEGVADSAKTSDGLDNEMLKTIQGLKTSDSSNVIIWEPNSTSHTDNGVKAAKDNYGLEIEETETAALEYLGIKAPISTPVAINSTSDAYFGTPNNLHTTPTNWSGTKIANIKLYDFEAGVSKVRIYAWIEGQDVDCENMASGSTFEFNLNFTTNPGA